MDDPAVTWDNAPDPLVYIKPPLDTKSENVIVPEETVSPPLKLIPVEVVAPLPVIVVKVSASVAVIVIVDPEAPTEFIPDPAILKPPVREFNDETPDELVELQAHALPFHARSWLFVQVVKRDKPLLFTRPPPVASCIEDPATLFAVVI